MSDKYVCKDQQNEVMEYIRANYWFLIVSLCNNYRRYITNYYTIEDLVADTYIHVCKIFFYPYNYDKLDQKAIMIRSIIQILDARFPKSKAKIVFDQRTRYLSDIGYKTESNINRWRPCENSVIIKIQVDRILQFITSFDPGRFIDDHRVCQVFNFIRNKFLPLLEYKMEDLSSIIDIFGHTIHQIELNIDRRWNLFKQYREFERGRQGEQCPGFATIPLFFQTACNYFVVKLRLFMFREGLFDQVLKGEM